MSTTWRHCSRPGVPRPWWEPDFPHWNPDWAYWVSGPAATASLADKLAHRTYHEIRYRGYCWIYRKRMTKTWVRDIRNDVGALAKEFTTDRLLGLLSHLTLSPFGRTYRSGRDVVFASCSLSVFRKALTAAARLPRSLSEVPVTLDAESFLGHTIN